MDDNHPVDRGWSWVILVGCTINLSLVIGTLKAFGVYFVAFLTAFDANVSMTSLISGILQAVYSLVSLPVLTIGLRHLSVRHCVLCGGCLVSSAFLLGSFAPNIEFLLFSNGILYGLGFGLIHGPSSFLIGLYFEKRRDLANAIIIAGGSLGGLLLPPVYRLLLDTYSLRGALLITSGLLLNIVASASLLRPVTFYKRTKLKTYTSETFLEKQPLNLKDNVTRVRSQSVTLGSNGHSTSIRENTTECLLQGVDRCASENFNSFKSKGVYDDLKNSDTSLVEKISHSSFVRFTSKGDLYTASLSALPSKPNSQNSASTSEQQQKQPTGVFKIITKDIQFSLLKNPLMILFLISFCFGSVGLAYGHLYIAAFAKDVGIDDQTITLIISTMSGCDFAGRILSGIVSDRKVFRNHVIVIFSMIICTLNMLLSFVYFTFWSIMIFCVVHGLFAGNLIALTPAVIIDFFGMSHYRSSMGMSLLCQGITLSTSAPLIGFIRDYTGTYTSSFQFIAACFLLSALTLLLEPCFRKYQLSDSKEKNVEIVVD